MPQVWRNIQANTGSCGLLQQRLMRNHRENQCQGRKTRTTTDELLKSQHGKLLKFQKILSHTVGPKDPQYYKVYLQQLNQAPTVNTGWGSGKSTQASGRVRKKETISEIPRELLLLKRPALWGN